MLVHSDRESTTMGLIRQIFDAFFNPFCTDEAVRAHSACLAEVIAGNRWLQPGFTAM
jgi:hypothetical protein